ncbi:twin-arginine translocase TatA/TatE family subunit [Streptomyces sp. NPDC020403]|uniref:twin-arginine translocase TatA/TatE family subunit n=1 Tax=unclassified Streptomyces TaxID=2593676 RepID=UPI0033CEA541
MLGMSEVAIILIVVILLIGAKKLPELARSAGKSARILKAEVRALKNKDAADPTPGTRGTRAPRVVAGETIPPRDADRIPRPQ